ncbi:MAG: SufE family protein [Verrucomicrobiales bacterium]|nr:SufE family protein [Verrucomicrobiales bacterium]
MIADLPVSGSLAEREHAAAAMLARFRDPQSRFAWLVDRMRERPHLPDEFRIDTHRVSGCLVRLWFVPELRDGRCWFRTDSDAVTLRAMTGFWCDLASGATPGELRDWHPRLLERLGVLRQMAENRQATVLRVGGQIRDFAIRVSETAS